MNGPHCSEAELLQILDGLEGPAPSTHRHVETCRECAGRLSSLRADADRFRMLVGAAHVPDGPKYAANLEARLAGYSSNRRALGGWRGPALALAASVVLLIAAPPVRAWVVAWIGGLIADDAPTAVVEPEPGSTSSEVAAQLAGPELVLDLGEGAGSVQVVLRRSADTLTRARVLGASEGVELLVSRDGFRVLGATEGTVRIALPPMIASVRITQGGEDWWSGAVPPDLTGGWTVPLPDR